MFYFANPSKAFTENSFEWYVKNAQLINVCKSLDNGRQLNVSLFPKSFITPTYYMA